MARITASDRNVGAPAAILRAVALTGVVLGGIAVAGGFLAPGLALAASLPTDATGAHPWIADGGGEVASNLSWRLEATVEYIAIGVASLYITLRIGKIWLAKLQDWYEAAPEPEIVPLELEPLPLATQFPAPRHRPNMSRIKSRAEAAHHDRQHLHAA